MKINDFINVLANKEFVYILRIFFRNKEDDYSEIYIGHTVNLYTRMKQHSHFFKIKENIKNIQLCYLEFCNKNESYKREREILLMPLDQQNSLLNSINQQQYREFNKTFFKNHIEIYTNAKKLFNSQTSYLHPGPSGSRRKFIERSKMIGFRVPISKCSELKEMIDEILEKFYRHNDLLAPEDGK